MQNLLSTESKVQQDYRIQPTLGNHSGTVLFFGALGVLLFKFAPHYWPFLLSILIGYTTVHLWRKKGFYFSLFLVVVASITMIKSGANPFWPLLLTGSIILSWFLMLLGRLEGDVFIQKKEEDFSNLEKQLRQAKVFLSEENRAHRLEKERLQNLYMETVLQLKQAEQSRESLENEQRQFNEKWEALSQKLNDYQHQISLLQQAAHESQTQLLKETEQQSIHSISENVMSLANARIQEEVEFEENRITQVQRQYQLLREQFEEKSQALDSTRKELFRLETEFLTLQKANEEKAYEGSQEELFLMKDLSCLEQECRELELQVADLQDFILSLLTPKKRATRAHKSPRNLEDQQLPFLIQEKISQITSLDSSIS